MATTERSVPRQKHPLAKCFECPLAGRSVAYGTGREGARIAVVSRSPGHHDTDEKKAFAGLSGTVLDHLLTQNKMTRDEVRVTNMVLCQCDVVPPEAIKCCEPRLLDEIKDAETVIAAGSEAVKYFTGESTIHAARGYVHDWRGKRLIATQNPAVVLRKSENFPDLVKDFRLAISPRPRRSLPEVRYTEKVDEAKKWLIAASDFEVLAADIETRGGLVHSATPTCIGFAANTDRAIVLGERVVNDPEFFHGPLRSFLGPQNTSTKFVWHNGKFDTKVLRYNGIPARIDEDTLLLSQALDERPGVHSLDYLCMEELGWPNYEPTDVKIFKKTGIISDITKLYKYNGIDCAGTLALLYLLSERCDKDDARIYRDVMLPGVQMFVSLELRGFRWDMEAACDLNEEYVIPKLRELRASLQATSGKPLLNPRSPLQMSALYYGPWNIKHGLVKMENGVNKKASSTDKDVRKEILEGRFQCNPKYTDTVLSFVGNHQVFSKIEKQRGTYIEGMLDKVNNGRLHSSFKFGTITGRTSSEEPNFQNITKDAVHGIPSMRSLFLASEGCKVVQADYSQAELRVLAKLSSKWGINLISIYRDGGRSLHKERALKFYGPDYTPKQYTQSKNINFGVTYGQSAFAFAQMYAMPQDEAQAYIDDWWTTFPELVEFIKDVREQVRKSGEIINPFGRKRRFHLLTKDNIEEAFREAVNFVAQSTASELTILSCGALDKEGVPLVCTVHDSIVADVPDDEVMDVAKRMKEVMENMPVETIGWLKDDIPFVADISIGENWGVVEEVTFA